MWCAQCQSDVAAELSADTRWLVCATCRAQLASPAQRPGRMAAHDAQQILERWSADRLLDPYGPVTAGRTGKLAVGKRAGEGPADDDAESAQQRPLLPIHGRRPPSLTSADHQFDVIRAALADMQIRRTNWVMLGGQLCAYAGVALLTCGTAVALYGHYGDHPGVAPTGWLMNAAGQMLLFLGVITLVSGGLEQTGDDVARRLDLLSDRLYRLEVGLYGEPETAPVAEGEDAVEAEAESPPDQQRRAAA